MTVLKDRGKISCPSRKSQPFSLVVLPDTQAYTAFYPHIFTCQTEWIKESRDKENIVFVVHEGDITSYNPEQKEVQWQRANESMSILDGVVPYCLCLGNHDIGQQTYLVQKRDTLFNKYFPYTRYEKEPWYGGHKDDNNDNCYCFFEASGIRFMIVSLEFMPPDETLEWANEVVLQHPDRRTIVLTHGYLFCDNTRLSQNTPMPRHLYVPEPEWGGNDGEQMWDKFVSLHPNIFLVLCGHVAGIVVEDPKPTGRLTSTGVNGNEVHQLLADYEWLEKGGNGWLRILQFYPPENKVGVQTYSPYLERFMDDNENQFELRYTMVNRK